MTYHVFFNPLANNRKGKEAAETLKAGLTDGNVELHNLLERKSYPEIFSSLPEEDAVILCGGDGTLNRFINETDGFDIRQQVYVYAAGSGNDFLRDVDQADDRGLLALDKYLKDLPSVTVNGKTCRFLNGVGYGIDGYCCEVGDQLRKTSDKPVNYAGIAIKGVLFHFKPVTATVTVDGKTEVFPKCWLAPTMNGRCYGGGMIPTPAQNRLDPEHKVSVLVWYGSGRLKTLTVFPKIFKGEHLKYSKICRVMTGHHVKVAFDRPCALQIDGETVLNVTEYEVTTV